MKDFDVFGLIKKHLNEEIKDQAVYFNPHPDMKKPCCVIELDEFWSHTIPLKESIKTLIKFRTTCFSDDNLLSTQIGLSKKVMDLLDGFQMKLDNNDKASVKFSKTFVHSKEKQTNQYISHIFEAAIRGG